MAKKAWGGRFKKETNPVVERFSASIATDIRLAQVDIQGSIAHASMLFRMGLISSDDRAAIVKGLKQLSVEFEQGKVDLDPKWLISGCLTVTATGLPTGWSAATSALWGLRL